MRVAWGQGSRDAAGEKLWLKIQKGKSHKVSVKVIMRATTVSDVCVGQEEICDPVSQVGCLNDETCVIGGGPAYGGIAYYCNVNTGGLPEGAACVDGQPDCAPGLICYEDICSAFCKPGVTACGVGACDDVSFVYNLPEAFIGICK